MATEPPSSRMSPEKSHREAEVCPVKPRTRASRGKLGCFPWIAGAVIAVVLGFFLHQRFGGEDEPPPPPRKTYTVAASDFYLAYLEGVELVAKCKRLFDEGRRRLGETAETLPESFPETRGGAEPAPAFKAAEKFALALEQIHHAEELLKTDTTGLKPQERACRDLLRENLEKYRGAVKIFNEYAKAQYQGSEAKAEKFALSDGMAKWEMAETLMAKQLEEGCNGEFFIYVQEQKPEFRRRAFGAYRDFFGKGFEPKRTVYSILMAYPEGVAAPFENFASPSPVPVSK